MPCSVKCMVVMKVAIATFPPVEVVVTRGSFYPGCQAPASGADVRGSAWPWQGPPPSRSGGTATHREGTGKCAAAGCDCAKLPRHGWVIRGRAIDRAGKRDS